MNFKCIKIDLTKKSVDLQTSETFVQVENNKVLHESGVEDHHLVARFETLWSQEADLKE